jgi:hypothetical protein
MNRSEIERPSSGEAYSHPVRIDPGSLLVGGYLLYADSPSAPIQPVKIGFEPYKVILRGSDGK